MSAQRLGCWGATRMALNLQLLPRVDCRMV